MKIISWNVNGIRSAVKKGFLDYVNEEDPDVICLQETKAIQGQAELDLPQYTEHWYSASRKGYSGTAIFTKKDPLSISKGILKDGVRLELSDKYGNANDEGRVLTAEFPDFYLVNVYTPNSKDDLTRLEFRHKVWDPAFLAYLRRLEQSKPVIFCGDLNVAHTEIDLARPKTNHKSHGFTAEEREGFGNFISTGYTDTFRHFHPGEEGHYTWWTHFANARARNVGWRIDYFLASSGVKDRVQEAFIRADVFGSDHCPVGVILKL